MKNDKCVVPNKNLASIPGLFYSSSSSICGVLSGHRRTWISTSFHIAWHLTIISYLFFPQYSPWGLRFVRPHYLLCVQRILSLLGFEYKNSFCLSFSWRLHCCLLALSTEYSVSLRISNKFSRMRCKDLKVRVYWSVHSLKRNMAQGQI